MGNAPGTPWYASADNRCLEPVYISEEHGCPPDTPTYVREGLEGWKREATIYEIEQLNLPHMPFYWEGGVYDPPREKKGVNPYKDDPKKLMNLNVIPMNLNELQLINMPVTPDNYNKECDKLRSYSEVV